MLAVKEKLEKVISDKSRQQLTEVIYGNVMAQNASFITRVGRLRFLMSYVIIIDHLELSKWFSIDLLTSHFKLFLFVNVIFTEIILQAIFVCFHLKPFSLRSFKQSIIEFKASLTIVIEILN